MKKYCPKGCPLRLFVQVSLWKENRGDIIVVYEILKAQQNKQTMRRQ